MSVVNPDDYRQGGVPTVFEDRTIFPAPEVIAQKVASEQKVVTRQSPLMGIIALLAIIACGVLGYLLVQTINEVEEAAQLDNSAVVARLEAEIVSLENDITSLRAVDADYRTIGTRLDKAEEVRADIFDLLDQPIRGNWQRNRDIRETIEGLPEVSAAEWERVAVEEIDEKLVDPLQAAYQKVRNYPTPQAPTGTTNRERVE
ncbi:MAG: hypothetical protein AAGJ29_00170 [Pseudomonadota bacterium]